MDVTLPEGWREGRARPRASLSTHGGVDPHRPMTAVSGGVRFAVLRFDDREIVVEDTGRAAMRGTVDLFAGGERVAHLLVQFAWRTEGRAGYELKRHSLIGPGAPVPHGMRRAVAQIPRAVEAG